MSLSVSIEDFPRRAARSAVRPMAPGAQLTLWWAVGDRASVALREES
jgi:hypothetical protein